MEGKVVSLPDQNSLRTFVRRTLCDHDRLDPEQTPLFATPIIRKGKTSGILFHVEGPRLLKTSALWSADDYRILFYNSLGYRFHDVRLSESPIPEEFIAHPLV